MFTRNGSQNASSSANAVAKALENAKEQEQQKLLQLNVRLRFEGGLPTLLLIWVVCENFNDWTAWKNKQVRDAKAESQKAT